MSIILFLFDNGDKFCRTENYCWQVESYFLFELLFVSVEFNNCFKGEGFCVYFIFLNDKS